VFDIITAFAVLQRQTDPSAFLAAARDCLRPRGFLALSVPNRDRWHTTDTSLGYPPEHFLRWNPDSLQAALIAQGFSVMSMQREKVTVPYAAQQLDGKLRSALAQLTQKIPGWPLDETQPDPPEADHRRNRVLPLTARAARLLTRVQSAACYPLAVPAAPIARWRGYAGPSLYCLARKLD
jgi:hypothetical protein